MEHISVLLHETVDALEVKADGDAVYLPGVVSRKKQMVPAIMGAFK